MNVLRNRPLTFKPCQKFVPALNKCPKPSKRKDYQPRLLKAPENRQRRFWLKKTHFYSMDEVKEIFKKMKKIEVPYT